MDPTLLWYLDRSTGLLLVLLLGAVTALGVLTSGGRPAGRLPRFATQALHRNLALVSLALLAAHVLLAVAHEYVDIRLVDAVLPGVARWEPLWLGLGTIATDLILVVAVTSGLRARLGGRSWRAVHLSAYAAWLLGTLHGLGIGTDLGWSSLTAPSWAQAPFLVGVALVVAAVGVRVVRRPAGDVLDPTPTAGALR
ncbi:ferric reductase-like transmembrane domain-containing protein [Nocardioides sp. GY 10127]|uniref:ferric reductase-like transmembrane domain-containing protein n=1 Tax=Nocardioides sp. GY 10127 TaxID=2569762 RepID=UPI0010A8826D|nr:ferric reductase-like transmembrane domain-containing protein [Nocardioides sp. GY 10127]TIC84466.1 ferric reductase [Nocardioides sp. GY 10127]